MGRCLNDLGTEGAGHLGRIIYAPTGPGARANDSYLPLRNDVFIGSAIRGGRLFGIGVRLRSGQYEQIFRIDYWDVRTPAQGRPTPNQLHVHYHVYSDGHFPHRTIWP
jgi:hypothetical protein